MSYGAYIARMNGSGRNPKESTRKVTKSNQERLIRESPSNAEVVIDGGEEILLSIVSDIETFRRRRFLFLPETEVRVGSYIDYENMRYLATDRKVDNLNIYPELFGEICNEEFPISMGVTEEFTGEYDWQGKPIYKEIEEIIYVDCVFTNKVYSARSNSEVPLPSGAMIVKLPYVKDQKIPLNFTYILRESQYKVIDVVQENVINDIGYVEVHLQREVSKHGELS